MHAEKRLVLLIFFLAFAARLLYLEQIKDDFLFYYPIADSGFYDYIGAKIAAGNATNESPPSRVPFYRYFLGTIYKLGGHNVYLALFIQEALGALSVCLVFLLAAHVFGEKTGLVSGIVASLYWPLIAFGAKFLPVNLAILFSLLSVFSAYKFLEKKKIFLAVASGAFLGLSCLARSNILLFFPVFLSWFFLYFRKKEGVKRAMTYGLAFLAGFLLFIAPPLLRDYASRKELVPVQNNYAVGIYFGTDMEKINIKPGYTWRKLMRELLAEGLVSTRERNAYWLEKAREAVLQDPLGYLSNLDKKFYVLWNYYEFSPRECINYLRKESRFLSLPLFNFGSIAAFSILGMILAWNKKRNEALPLCLFVSVYFISLLPFMPLARYRLPIAPIFIIFASYGAVELFEKARGRKWADVSKFAAVVIPVFILTNTNFLYDYLENFTRPLYHRGRAYLKQRGREEEALSDFKIALEKHPRDADIYKSMGDAYIELGNMKKAESSYKKALGIESAFPEAMNSLGVVCAKEGKIQEAKDIFEKVLSGFPEESVQAHINLGNCFLMEGNYEMAEKEYKRAIFLEPKDRQVKHRLAALYEELAARGAR